MTTSPKTDVLNHIKLNPNETKSYSLNMTNTPQVDGSYIVGYKLKGSDIRKQEHFGYFTNGYPNEELTKITIKTDTVIIDYK